MAVKICLTGGPCGGKSSSIVAIEEELTARGYKVLVIPETATELIVNGLNPGELETECFQRLVFEKQFNKERLYEKAAEFFSKAVIICDRGFFDALAYMNHDMFVSLAKEYGMTESDLYAQYDGVIHLVTAADGTNHYTLENNKARTETAEEAIIADRLTRAAWCGHPHLRVIDNSTGFNEKIKRVLEEIMSLLGEPFPMEIERKFLIKKPDTSIFDKLEFCNSVEISQTYLTSSDKNTERRVRQRGTKEKGYNYYYTEKTAVDSCSRIEIEKKISQREFCEFLSEADPLRYTVRKRRYCFLYKNQYFELDIYPFCNEHAIIEVELKDKNTPVELPDFLEIIKEVTGIKEYSNASISETLVLPL